MLFLKSRKAQALDYLVKTRDGWSKNEKETWSKRQKEIEKTRRKLVMFESSQYIHHLLQTLPNFILFSTPSPPLPSPSWMHTFQFPLHAFLASLSFFNFQFFQGFFFFHSQIPIIPSVYKKKLERKIVL